MALYHMCIFVLISSIVVTSSIENCAKGFGKNCSRLVRCQSTDERWRIILNGHYLKNQNWMGVVLVSTGKAAEKLFLGCVFNGPQIGRLMYHDGNNLLSAAGNSEEIILNDFLWKDKVCNFSVTSLVSLNCWNPIDSSSAMVIETATVVEDGQKLINNELWSVEQSVKRFKRASIDETTSPKSDSTAASSQMPPVSTELLSSDSNNPTIVSTTSAPLQDSTTSAPFRDSTTTASSQSSSSSASSQTLDIFVSSRTVTTSASNRRSDISTPSQSSSISTSDILSSASAPTQVLGVTSNVTSKPSEVTTNKFTRVSTSGNLPTDFSSTASGISRGTSKSPLNSQEMLISSKATNKAINDDRKTTETPGPVTTTAVTSSTPAPVTTTTVTTTTTSSTTEEMAEDYDTESTSETFTENTTDNSTVPGVAAGFIPGFHVWLVTLLTIIVFAGL